jgi:AcrR family transcriptional regulator
MARSSDRKALILRVAAVLFARKGYWDTSLTEIAQAADSSVGSLMNFYGSKPQLALAVRESIVSALADAIAAALGTHREEIEKGVIAVQVAYLEWVIASPDRARLLRDLAGLMVGAHSSDQDLLAPVSEALGRWAAPLMARGLLPILPPDRLLAVILGPVVFLSWTTHPRRLESFVRSGTATKVAKAALNELRDHHADVSRPLGQQAGRRRPAAVPINGTGATPGQMALAFSASR